MTPAVEPFIDILVGDVRDVLQTLPDNHVQLVVTSPPYWGLRNYGIEGQFGLEKTVEGYVANLVDVFEAMRRVLRPDGNFYLNMGDCYAANRSYQVSDSIHKSHDFAGANAMRPPRGTKPKDLIGVPWLLAFALRDAGWYLREDIIWHKPNPMPESVTDRCTRSHEYLFHFAKSARYFYDHEAIKEPYQEHSLERYKYAFGGKKNRALKDGDKPTAVVGHRVPESMAGGGGRNRRDVWTIATQPYSGGHFAAFPEQLVEPCILAGTSSGGQCAVCGAVAKHVVIKTDVPEENRRALAEARGRTAAVTGRTDGHTSYKPPQPHRDILVDMYEPCACGDGMVPQVVLDPFVGSGRTGIVAKRHGRSFIGIDLNPDYAMQALANIEGEQPSPVSDQQAAAQAEAVP